MHAIRLGSLYLSQVYPAACWSADADNALPFSSEGCARWWLARLREMGVKADGAEVVWL